MTVTMWQMRTAVGATPVAPAAGTATARTRSAPRPATAWGSVRCISGHRTRGCPCRLGEAELGALEREQQPPAVEPARVAGQRAVRADDAMAREHDRDRVPVHD